MSLRWTPEALEAFEKRAEEWKAKGIVRTHRIAPNEAQPANKRGGRKPKYGNVKAEADGFIFHSKKEKKRWMELRLQEKAGEIRELKRQVEYPIAVNGVDVCRYFADFTYLREDALVVEDAKGYETNEFRLKAKLMLAVHGIEVLLT